MHLKKNCDSCGHAKRRRKSVNTRVKDPQNRKLNRNLDRQEKTRMKLDRKTLVDPLGSSSDSLVEMHTLRIAELKKERNKLKANRIGEPKK